MGDKSPKQKNKNAKQKVRANDQKRRTKETDVTAKALLRSNKLR